MFKTGLSFFSSCETYNLIFAYIGTLRQKVNRIKKMIICISTVFNDGFSEVSLSSAVVCEQCCFTNLTLSWLVID